MTYRRGTASVEVELANVQSMLEILDPKVDGFEARIEELEEVKNKLQGALRVIIWMNSVTMLIVVAILGAFLTWMSNHISIRTNFDAPGVSLKANPTDATTTQSVLR